MIGRQLLSGLLCLSGAMVNAQSQESELIFPILAGGSISEARHFQSAISLTNAGEGAGALTFEAFDNLGKSSALFTDCLPAAPGDDSSQLDLAAHGSAFLSGDVPSTLDLGWARLSWTGVLELSGSAEVAILEGASKPCEPLDQRPAEEVFTSARVEGVRPGTRFTVAVTITASRHTGVAIVNPSPTETANLAMTLRDGEGKVLIASGGRPASGDEYPLHRQSRLVGFAWELIFEPCRFLEVLELICIAAAPGGPPAPEEFRGTLTITSDRPVAVGSVDVVFPSGKLVSNATVGKP